MVRVIVGVFSFDVGRWRSRLGLRFRYSQRLGLSLFIAFEPFDHLCHTTARFFLSPSGTTASEISIRAQGYSDPTTQPASLGADGN